MIKFEFNLIKKGRYNCAATALDQWVTNNLLKIYHQKLRSCFDHIFARKNKRRAQSQPFFYPVWESKSFMYGKQPTLKMLLPYRFANGRFLKIKPGPLFCINAYDSVHQRAFARILIRRHHYPANADSPAFCAGGTQYNVCSQHEFRQHPLLAAQSGQIG